MKKQTLYAGIAYAAAGCLFLLLNIAVFRHLKKNCDPMEVCYS